MGVYSYCLVFQTGSKVQVLEVHVDTGTSQQMKTKYRLYAQTGETEGNKVITHIAINIERLKLGGKKTKKSAVHVTLHNDTLSWLCYMYLSRFMRKQDFCLGENKGTDQLRSNCEADQRLYFRYSDSTIPLLLKAKISSL